MVFSVYKYKEFNNANRELWPNKSWNKMVCEEYKYCKKWNVFKWIEFYFYVKIKGISDHGLICYHPYWALKVRLVEIKNIRKTLKAKLKNIIKDLSYWFYEIKDKTNRFLIRSIPFLRKKRAVDFKILIETGKLKGKIHEDGSMTFYF